MFESTELDSWHFIGGIFVVSMELVDSFALRSEDILRLPSSFWRNLQIPSPNCLECWLFLPLFQTNLVTKGTTSLQVYRHHRLSESMEESSLHVQIICRQHHQTPSLWRWPLREKFSVSNPENRFRLSPQRILQTLNLLQSNSLSGFLAWLYSLISFLECGIVGSISFLIFSLKREEIVP